MRTASKIFLVLTLALVHAGCRSWCGDGCNNRLTNAPAWNNGPAAVSAVPDVSREQVGLYSAPLLAGDPTATQNVWR